MRHGPRPFGMRNSAPADYERREDHASHNPVGMFLWFICSIFFCMGFVLGVVGGLLL